MMSSKRKRIAALSIAAAALVAAGCGSDGEPASEAASGAQATTPATTGGKGVPKALAANRAEANEILDEGSLDAKLADLEGHPVVVNQWASWCEPCRAELPLFSDSANANADEIAFLGIDMQDDLGAAEQFLSEVPLPFPSVFDPDAAAISSLGGGIVSPTTVFIDEEGEVVNVFQGSYTSREQLEGDIERHLLK